MNIHAMKRPDLTPREKASPIIKRSLDDYEVLIAQEKYGAATKAWNFFLALREAFDDGLAFAERLRVGERG